MVANSSPNTQSIFTDAEGRNQTRTGVSTNIIIEVDGNAVGAISDISINEDRDIAMIDEVGTDGHIDSVPKSSTNISGSCTRTRFDSLRILHAFSRGYIHVAAQRTGFDIIIKDIFAAEGGTDGIPDPQRTLVTTIKNVWISKVGVKYTSSDFVVVENMDWKAETIFSTLGSNSSAVTPNGGRNINIIDINPFEQDADVGRRRGAIDAAGLLLAVDETV